MQRFKKLALACALAVVGVSAQAATYKLATNVGDNSIPAVLLGEFSKSVEAKTQGRVKFKIYNNSVLGDQPQYLQQIQKSLVDAGLVNSATMENMMPAYGALNLPYVFRTTEEYKKVLTNPQVKKALTDPATAHNFVPLGFVASSFRSMYTTKPVKSFDDLKGMKLRTMPSETYIDMLKLFGVVPTPLPLGELFSAMQTGVVDGAEGGLGGLYNMKMGEVAKYAIRTDQTRLTDFIVMSNKLESKISKEDMAIVRTEFAKMSEKSIIAMDTQEEADIQASVKTMGVKLIEIDKAPLMKAVEPMYAKALKNKEQGDMLKLIFSIEGRKL